MRASALPPGQIAGPQQPACQPGLDGMRRVAGGRLLRLRQYHLFMADQAGAERLAVASDLPQHFNLERGSAAVNLDQCLAERDAAVERRCSSDDAVFADHRGFDHFAVLEFDDEGDGAAVQEIDAVDGLACLLDHMALDHFHHFKVRLEAGQHIG